MRITNAIGVLGIAAFLAAIPLGVGCGGGDNGSERAVEWGVDRPLGPKRVRLSAVIEPCIAEASRLEEPIIEYNGDRVYIEIREAPEELEVEPTGCFLELQVAHPTIALERDLDELVLFDASTDPPEKRWPIDQARR